MTESLWEQLAQWCFNLPYSNPTLKKNKTLSNKFNKKVQDFYTEKKSQNIVERN